MSCACFWRIRRLILSPETASLRLQGKHWTGLPGNEENRNVGQNIAQSYGAKRCPARGLSRTELSTNSAESVDTTPAFAIDLIDHPKYLLRRTTDHHEV